MAGKFIAGAIEHPGAATRKAKAEGLTVREWALKHRHDQGTTGRQARFALTLEKMRQRRRRKG